MTLPSAVVKRAEATALRAAALEDRLVAKGVALAGKRIPDTLLASIDTLPGEQRSVLRCLVEEAGEAATDLTVTLLARANRREATAEALDVFAIELEAASQ